MRELVAEFKTVIHDRLHIKFPDNPQEQLWGAIGAVFGSWNNPRAITYRKIENIPNVWGTAVTVQAMVFGNLGKTGYWGRLYSRSLKWSECP